MTRLRLLWKRTKASVMTKLELNDKLAELYGELNFKYASKYLNIKIFLIDDWSRLMGLAVDNGICIHIYEDCVICAKYVSSPSL